MSQPDKPGTVGFVSLGCPKALVDSERILTQLRLEGYAIVPDYESADVVVVNTCGFIDSAKQESLEAIGEAIQENGRVIVTGCLGAEEKTIRSAHPDILAVSGPQAYEEVVTAVQQHAPSPTRHDPFVDLLPPQGIKLTPAHYAYLKISEGCNHSCSFCIIPSMRGKLRSRPINEVLEEAEQLAASGVQELLVISQDTSAYGVDLRYQEAGWNGHMYQTNLADLAYALGELGIWVRLHYVYPYPNVDKIIPLMQEGRVLPYLDIPFQHASHRILKAMRRPAHAENILKRVQTWRDICPELVIRSTFIVGFPGETEQDFEQLLEFLQAAQLDRVGCFQYSPVAGAAANDLPNAVPQALKQERYERFMETQAAISAAKLQKRVGSTLTVLVDELSEQGVCARSYGDAPEIDGLVYVSTDQTVEIGDLLTVEVTAADDYDLYARLADKQP